MLIGITGLAGSGKDTAADFLVRWKSFAKVAFADPMKRVVRDVYGFSHDQLWGPSSARNAPDERYPREHGPFKDGKRCLCCGFGFDLFPFELSGLEHRPQCFLTPRFALQQLGSEWGRGCYPHTWIDYALRVADKLQAGGYEYDAVHGLRPIRGTIPWDEGENVQGVVISDVRFENEVECLKSHGAKLIRIVRPGAGLGGGAGSHGSEVEQASIPDSIFDAVIQNDKTVVELCETVDALVQSWGAR